ncbi:glycosyltransferase family 4 protein [Chitinophaga sedimenti]|uniref:glycosyltransferase family 4 protein n=1 Tax=Chitinophaga sedimenti TaxID=2033606 RepID=UPI0027E17BF1|nr:glycosyltransferase family 4 protein [Chitinophaga sedimenti]
MPSSYIDKIQLIINGIQLPEDTTSLVQSPGLKCLYVGRGDIEQKRVHLVAEVARWLQESGTGQMTYMGNVKPAIPEALQGYGVFLGEKSDPAEMDRIYREHHALVLLSAYEGFPMVVMEAMARGLSIVSTGVGDIPFHVKHEENGLLIGEADILEHTYEALQRLATDPALQQRFRDNNITYARAHFGMNAFAGAYRALLT